MTNEAYLTDASNITPDVEIHLEGCGMGMPVITTWQALKKLSIGGVVLVTSWHN